MRLACGGVRLIEDPGHTRIKDLGCRVGGENTIERVILVNDWRRLAIEVEIAQAQSHIMKDGVANLLQENAVLLTAGGAVDGGKLHDYGGCSCSLLEKHSHKIFADSRC